MSSKGTRNAARLVSPAGTRDACTDHQQPLEPHALASLFLLPSAEEYGALVESLRTNGFVSGFPIFLFGGKILDSRSRYRACLETEVEPTFKEFEGDDDAALRFVCAANATRRSPDQPASSSTIRSYPITPPPSSPAFRIRPLQASGRTSSHLRKFRTSLCGPTAATVPQASAEARSPKTPSEKNHGALTATTTEFGKTVEPNCDEPPTEPSPSESSGPNPEPAPQPAQPEPKN
jgi:hypothetical protein